MMNGIVSILTSIDRRRNELDQLHCQREKILKEIKLKGSIVDPTSLRENERMEENPPPGVKSASKTSTVKAPTQDKTLTAVPPESEQDDGSIVDSASLRENERMEENPPPGVKSASKTSTVKAPTQDKTLTAVPPESEQDDGSIVDSASLRENERMEENPPPSVKSASKTSTVKAPTQDKTLTAVPPESEQDDGSIVDSASLRENERMEENPPPGVKSASKTSTVKAPTQDKTLTAVPPESEQDDGSIVDSASLRENERMEENPPPGVKSASKTSTGEAPAQDKELVIVDFENPTVLRNNIESPRWLIVSSTSKVFQMKIMNTYDGAETVWCGYYNGNDVRRTWKTLEAGENLVSPRMSDVFSHNNNFDFVLVFGNRRTGERDRRQVCLKFSSKAVDIDRDATTSKLHIASTTDCQVYAFPSPSVVHETEPVPVQYLQYHAFLMKDKNKSEAAVELKFYQRYSLPISMPVFWSDPRRNMMTRSMKRDEEIPKK